MEKSVAVPVEELLKAQGLNESDLEAHRKLGTNLHDLLEEDIHSHHSAYRNVISQQELFEAGQHWSDWE